MKDRPESRKHVRHPLKVEIEVGDGYLDGEISFDSQDISEGGVFLQSDLLLEVGESFWICFVLPGTLVNIRTQGKVVWVNKRPKENHAGSPPGMGVQFIDLSEEERKALNNYLREANGSASMELALGKDNDGMRF